MTSNEFLNEVYRICNSTDQRFGQAAWNVALERFPEIVGPLVGTNRDPFYNDSNVNALIDVLPLD